MITIHDKMKCTGCTACASICPVQCIEMKTDEEGFRYPSVDLDLCIHCNQCESVCEVLNPPQRKPFDTKYLSGKTDSLKEQRRSASGGAFHALASAVLKRGGLVYGAGYDDENLPCHMCISDVDDLCRLQGSKYVESDLGNTFQTIKEVLSEDEAKEILFSGTPCQVNGLRKFLRKDYENVYYVEIICHGIASRKIYAKFKHDFEKKNGKVETINFRSKALAGWSPATFEIHTKKKKYQEIFYKTDYGRGFGIGLFARPSCFQCPFAKLERTSDLTLGDYWNVPKEEYDENGLSLILVNTSKGEQLVDKTENLLVHTADKDRALEGNPRIYSSLKEPEERHDVLASDRSFKEIVDQYGFAYPLKNRVIDKIPVGLRQGLIKIKNKIKRS